MILRWKDLGSHLGLNLLWLPFSPILLYNQQRVFGGRYMKDKTYKFNTYDDMISCLDFIDDMFENAIVEIEKEKKK